MPCYNAQVTLKEAIESIIKQSYTNWELIIVDDASTDKSYKIAQSYAKKHSNITVLKNNTNQGCYYSRNRALYYMKDKDWDVFTTHDADDTSTPDRFQLYIKLFRDYPKVKIINGVYQGKRWRGNSKNNKFIKYKKSYAAGIVWFHKEVFYHFGYYDNTRFSGDKEYLDRIEYFLQVCWGDNQYQDELKKIKLNPPLEISYCYKVSPTLSPSLSLSISLQEKKDYIKSYQEKFASWVSLNEFYQKFTPHKKDL